MDTGTEHNLTHNARVVDALAEVLISGVVCEPAELVLDGLGQRRLVDVRVLCLLPSELGVKVGRVQHGFLRVQGAAVSKRARRGRCVRGAYDGGLEWRLNLLRDQSDVSGGR